MFGVKGFQITKALISVSAVCMKQLGVQEYLLLLVLKRMVSLIPKINALLRIYAYSPRLSRRLDISQSPERVIQFEESTWSINRTYF